MESSGLSASRHGLDLHGIRNAGTVYWNLPPAHLYEHAIRRGEAILACDGPLVAETGKHTGRSPHDKFLVKETGTEDVWWGDVNRSVSAEAFDFFLNEVRAYAAGRDLYVFNGYAGADPSYRINVRVINENAWQNLFARNMFLREEDSALLTEFSPDFTVINLPGYRAAEPEKWGLSSPAFILLSLSQRIVLIGGTQYAGEIKKSIFTAMNYILPKKQVLSMHCSANYGTDRDDVALFFGLSGTGKTTLSADPNRTLIGDDEHGWSDAGVFNIEGGCYAKVIRLDPLGEPEIFATTQRFGTILENVTCDPITRRLDLDDASRTENTRASYPITQLRNVDPGGAAGHPRNVIFLTCDAFGVLPPISQLTPAQAMYHFLSGYTAKVAGTERGVAAPSATFSACFGAPFLPLHPGVYARMLGKKLQQHGAKVWLVNTGWTGGPCGEGSRIQLRYTRTMVTAALSGTLDDIPTTVDSIFGLAIPTHVEGVPDDVLTPRRTWADPTAYDARAHELARMFNENFASYASGVDDDVKAAGPKLT